MSKAKKYLVLDTETASLTGEVYDMGWVVCKKDGKPLVSRTFLVEEVLFNPELMMGAYYGKKIFSYYLPLIANGKISILPWESIAEIFRQDMENHKIACTVAYNLPFDMRACKQMVKTYGKKPLLSYKTDLLCLWETCCRIRLNTVGYKEWAAEHGFISDAGNFRTTAECAYRFMNQCPDFKESHTALDDALIEAELLAWCIKRRKKMPYNVMSGQPWRLLKTA